MEERLKKIRKNFKLNQKEFGDRLGLSRDVISNIELGRVELKEHIIKLICNEFNVSYIWLKTGEGEMFDLSVDDTTALFDRIMAGENEIAKNVFRAFSKLSDEEWKVVEKIIDDIKK